jgi:hypothetical protein
MSTGKAIFQNGDAERGPKQGANMFAERLATAISTASLRSLDQLSRTIWQGHNAGAFTDAEAQRLAEQIEARRTPARAAHKPVGVAPGRVSSSGCSSA